jgi:hypothetical protein
VAACGGHAAVHPRRASVLVAAGGGLYRIVGGILAAIADSVANVGVLLVEILRWATARSR